MKYNLLMALGIGISMILLVGAYQLSTTYNPFTGKLDYILSETSLNVNGSDFWDSFDSINTSVFRDEAPNLGINMTWWETYYLQISEIGNIHDQDLNTTDNVEFVNITTDENYICLDAACIKFICSNSTAIVINANFTNNSVGC